MLNTPIGSDIEVLLRSIDLITMTRPKALLWQTQIKLSDDDAEAAVAAGGAEAEVVAAGGTLIGSGLNLLMTEFGSARYASPPRTLP